MSVVSQQSSSVGRSNGAARTAPIAPALPVPGEPLFYGLSAVAWVKIAAVALLMGALFRFALVRLWLKTNPFFGEPNWGHAICVPLIGLYYLHLHREELLRCVIKPAWSGLLILLGGLLLHGYGIWPGQNHFVQDFGIVTTLFGVVVLLAGWPVMKIAWFPIAFLVCAIPWPDQVYSWVAGPLQHLAAKVAVQALKVTGVMAFHNGTKIVIGGFGEEQRILNVAEACAGLRSLMTFISVGAAVAFLSPRGFWQKVVLTASAVPIAIFCNVLRVTGQGLLDYYVSHELSESFAHQFVGLIMLIPAFFLLLLVGWVMDKLFIEVVDEEAEAATAAKEKDLVLEVPRRMSVPVSAAASAAGAAAKPMPAPQAKPAAPAPVKTAPAPVKSAPAPVKPAPKPVAPPPPAGGSLVGVAPPPAARPGGARRTVPPRPVTPKEQL